MPIEMISPRTVYNRRPLGRYVVDNKCNIEDDNAREYSSNNEFWIVRTLSNKQTELYVRGRHAVLHNFTALDKNHLFTGFTEKPITCATFACLSHKESNNASMSSIFEEINESVPTGVMLFTKDIGKFYSFNAEIESCKLPCAIGHVWTLRNCLLAERLCRGDGTQHYNTSMFALTHCLAEFTPVVFVDDVGHNGFVSDTHIRIAAVCEESLLLLGYNKRLDTFVLWRVRDAVRGDFEDLYEANVDGSVTAKMNTGQSRRTNVKDNLSKMMEPKQDCHSSREYFEYCSRPLVDVYNKTIDDLDLRSPMARSLKNISDSNLSVKTLSLQNNSKKQISRMVNRRDKFMEEPLYPKLCLQHLYSFKPLHTNSLFNPNDLTQHSTPMNGGKSARTGLSSDQERREASGFFAEDFYNRKYLCCMQSVGDRTHMLMVKFNYDGQTFTHFEDKRLTVLDAIYLQKLKLIVILEENKTISLYTGMAFICKISLLNAMVHEPDLFEDSIKELSTEDINNLVRLSEPTDCGFTLHTKSGLSLRLYLPEMVRFHLVQKCLMTLKKLLPIDVGTTLLCRWYSLNRAVDNNESTSVEWPRFVDFLLENLGFRKGAPHLDSVVRDVTDLNFNCCESKDTDVNMEEVSAKKSRTNRGVYSFEDRSKSRDRLDDFSCLALNASDKLLAELATTVLYSLHLVYETEKLNFSSCLYLENLAALNCALAYATESALYLEYYVNDYPDLWPRVNKLPSIRQLVGRDDIWQQEPPDWSRWLSAVMDGLSTGAPYPIIEDLNEMTMSLMCLFLVVFRHPQLVADAALEINRHLCRIRFNSCGLPTRLGVCDESTHVVSKAVLKLGHCFQRAACYLSEMRFHTTDLDYLNPGLATIIRVICFKCSNSPPNFCNANLYGLLNRTDLEKQRLLILPIIDESRVREVISTPPKEFRRLSEVRQNCYSYWCNNVQFTRGIPSTMRKNRAIDNCYLLSVLQDDPIIRLAFPDIRVGEAYKMLQSCSPVQLDVSICTHFTRDEGDTPSEALKEELDSHLKTITSQRTFALAFGRGMLGLQVLNSNSLTDTLHVPVLCLSGKYLLSDSGKPHTVENTTSIKPWPSFHNGVAAGLMVSPMNHLVDYVWILKQCPSHQLDLIELSPEKAGLLFGLALNGHLNKLSSATIGNTIKSMNEMATMAVLIGLSAHNLGSKNLVLSKHISFHYRRLIPEEKDHNEQIPSHSQVSAIISAGLLNFKSGDRKMARIFIEEMGRSREYLTADKSSLLDIELTSVTAGFSVGLIMFQQGDTFSREYNSEELTRLMNYLKGGYRFPGKENTSPEAPSDSHIRTLIKNVETKRPQPISQADTWNSFQTTNPRVLEGEYYNTDITGPGAAVALGMIFMASSNVVVAQQLQCPQTFILLEEIRSPLLCFRQIAWGMVTWREIRPTRAWVESSIPEFISSNALLKTPNGISEKYWDTANESYLQLLVGSCFVMGLRYAGTDNSDARDTIIRHIERLLEVKREPALMETLNRCQYDWALSTIFLAACMVTAGTGNLQLLKIVRALRSVHHPKEFANYGVNTAYSMAIGLLFLGGGKLTLSNSPRCAALLLISFFPRFPPTYSGKRYHLQALRHLYVIATRPRVMCAVDIDTQTAVSISSRVVLKNETRDYQGCFVYPADDPATIKEIEFYHKDGKYYPQKYRPGTESWRILLESFLTGGYFFVKSKSSEQSLQSILGKYSTDKALRGFHLGDYELLVDFLDSTSCSEISGIQQQKIVYYFMDHKESGIKEVVSRAAGLEVAHFSDTCTFYDWCHQRGLLTMLSTFLVYMKTSLRSLRSIAQGRDHTELLSDEAWFLMQQIMD